MHNLLTVKETAKYLRIPLPTVYYLVQRGQLPAIQIGGRWRIKKSSLDKDILKEEKPGQPTVLVVDDDEHFQNLVKVFFRNRFDNDCASLRRYPFLFIAVQMTGFLSLLTHLLDSTGHIFWPVGIRLTQ